MGEAVTVQSEQRPTVMESRIILLAGLLGILAGWVALWIWAGPFVFFCVVATIVVASIVYAILMAWIASVVA